MTLSQGLCPILKATMDVVLLLCVMPYNELRDVLVPMVMVNSFMEVSVLVTSPTFSQQ